MNFVVRSSNLLKSLKPGVVCWRRLAWNPPNKRKKFSKYGKQMAIEARIQQTLKDSINCQSTLNHSVWSEVKSTALASTGRRQFFTKENIDSQIVKNCDELGKALSFVEYLRAENIEMNVMVQMNLLNLIRQHVETNGKTDDLERMTIDLCNKVRVAYPVMDSTIREILVSALLCTNDWRTCLELVDESPQEHLSIPVYADFIAKAFDEDDGGIGWPLLRRFIAMNYSPPCRIFTSYWNHCRRQKDVGRAIEIMFEFLAENMLLVSANVVKELEKLLNEIRYSNKRVKIVNRNLCPNCEKRLKIEPLTDDEFELLKQKFVEVILVAENIFLRTSQEEFESFKAFVSETAPFDLVIDGLNIAHALENSQPDEKAKMLDRVVSYYHSKGKRVLVVGRTDMLEWPRKTMERIESKADVFLVNILSKDDLFILYATLLSGPQTNFLSNDLMRNHAHRLHKMTDKSVRWLFERWIFTHQHRLVEDQGSQKVRGILRFDALPFAYKTQDFWHIPFLKEFDPTHLTKASHFTMERICIKFSSK